MRAEGLAGGGDLFLSMLSPRVVSVGTQSLGAHSWGGGGGNATSVCGQPWECALPPAQMPVCHPETC